jgi:hypothetical protein
MASIPTGMQMMTWNQPGSLAYLENTSGMGGPVPIEIRMMRWNWGGFCLPFLWMLNHGMIGWGICLFVVQWIPFVGMGAGLIASIALGASGNEIAWQRRRFSSLDEFRAVEKAWTTWGISLLVSCFLMGLLAGFVLAAH